MFIAQILFSPNRPVADDGPGLSNTNDMNEPDNTFNMDVASHDIEEIETMRDAVADPNPVAMPELLDNQITCVTSPIAHSEPIIRDKETPILSEENVLVQDPSPLTNPFSGASRGSPDPFQLNPSPPSGFSI